MNARRKGLTSSRGPVERGQFSAVLGHEDFAKQPGKRCRMRRERRDLEKPDQAALAGAVRADGRSGFETKLRTSGFGRSRHLPQCRDSVALWGQADAALTSGMCSD
jgi:hypothetical protein